MDFDPITKAVGTVTAVIAMLGGGYGLADKWGFLRKDILRWEPEYFQVSDGQAGGKFQVIVARQKLRDDCDVVDFRLDVRDSGLRVHPVIPDVAVFSGPAANQVDKFAYTIAFPADHHEMVSAGTAVLLGRIKYRCPEGDVLVHYPRHKNLQFEITR